MIKIRMAEIDKKEGRVSKVIRSYREGRTRLIAVA
jgi:hypothetical protein